MLKEIYEQPTTIAMRFRGRTLAEHRRRASWAASS
jgi:hypothetical protein